MRDRTQERFVTTSDGSPRAAGHFPDGALVNELVRAWDRNDRVAVLALFALVRSAHANLRREGAWALSETLRFDPVVEEFIVDLLHDDEPSVRAYAAEHITSHAGAISREAVVAALALLDDPHAAVRETAARCESHLREAL